MAALATFTAPNGQDASVAIRAEIRALTSPSVGDLLHVGQIFRSRIRQRTFAGVDVNGAAFAPYSTKGPFYFSPAGSATKDRAARATAAGNRHAKTGRIGVRTATGIKYESYAAAKSAHGVAGVNLYGMEQGAHMLDAIMVRAGGSEASLLDDQFSASGDNEMGAFEQNQAANALTVGFYGDEAGRAKGHNEGTAKLPKREFFALNNEDLMLAEKAIAQRMMIRAKQGGGGGTRPLDVVTPDTGGDWLGF